MSQAKIVFKSAIWVTFSEILFNMSGFIIHSVLGRFLGPADYGRYSLIITLTTTVIILIGNGIPTAMAKYISEYFETDGGMVKIIKKQAIFLQSIIIGALTVLFFLSAPLIANLLGDPTLAPLFQLSSLIIPAFAAASFYFSYYTGLHRFNMQATLKTLRSIFRIVFVIILALMFRVKGAVIGYILAPAAVFLVAYFTDTFKIDKEIRAIGQNMTEPHFERKKLVNYAWQIVVFFLAYQLLTSIDLYIVQGVLRDETLTGLYNAANTVGNIPYYIFYALTIFMLPMVSKSTSQNDLNEAGRIISKAMRIMVILLLPMVILMAVFARPILVDFYGIKYAAAAPVMAVLEGGIGFLTIFYVMSFALTGAGKTRIPMIISVFGLALNTVLNYIFVQKFSIVGSALGTATTSIAITIPMLYYVYRDFGIFMELKSFLKILLASAAMFFASFLFSQGQVAFIFWSLILFALYLLTLYILGEITKDDITYLKTISKKKKVSEVEEELSGNEPAA